MDVDSLDIKISAEAKKANDAIDSIIDKLGSLSRALNIDTSKLGSIGKNLNFSEITNSAKTMSENVSKATAKVAESMKPIETQTNKVSKSIEQTISEISDKYKDLGKGFKFEGTTEQVRKESAKLFNSLEKAKVEMQRMSLSDNIDTSKLEKTVAKVAELQNKYESLQTILEESSRAYKEGLKAVEEQANRANESLQNVADEAKNFSDALDKVGISTGTKNAKAELEEYTRLLENAKSAKQALETIGATEGKPYLDAIKNISAYENKIKEISKEIDIKANIGGFNEIEEKIDALRQKFKDVGTEFVFKGNAEQLTKEIDRVSTELDKLYARQDKMISLGKIDTAGFEALQYDISEASNRLEILRNTVAETGASVQQSSFSFSSFGSAINNAFSGMMKTLQKVNRVINSVLSKLGKLIKSMFLLGNSAKSSGKGFNLSLMTILKYGLGIRSLYVLFNKLRNAVKEGMENLIQYSDKTNQSVSMLKSSLNQFKNSAAAAFAPVLNAIAPILNNLIQLFIRATNAVNQFFAALTGQSTWIKAKYVYEDAAEKISGAAKAAKGALQPFDKLNNLTSQTGAGGGGALPEDMFETLPIEDKFKNLSDKIKDIMSKLFAPLKEAWNREGKFVMDSWKYALDEVWKLIKDIGRDFLTVWQQEKTIKIFEDILHIIGDIELAIGHLARNFRDAWNENETGLKILQNIRDIIGVIIHNIRLAADATVEWADQLDFSPLLEAFERFTASLVPVADTLSGILTDFYTQVLLPLGKWTLEKGLPELLDVFTKFNEKVDWTALRDNLSEFWNHLEPFAETVGEGLILFIERVSNALADFLNSQEFKNFLVMIENWMDSVTPEDVANGLELIAKGLIALKLAVLGFSAISAITGVLTTLKTFFSFFGVGGGATGASGAMLGTAEAASGLGVAISGLTTALAVVATAVASWHIGSWIAEKLELDPKPFKETMSEIKDSFTDGSWKDALKLWGDDIYNGFVAIGDKEAEVFENIKTNISDKFKEIQTGISTKLTAIKTNWFTAWETLKGKVTTIFSGITTTIGNAINSILTKIDTLVQKIKGVSGKAQSALGGGFGGGIGNIVGNATGKRTATYNAGISTASVYNYEIPTYAAGGFPQTYSLFAAGENGVAEMLGTVGGKTAVAGGAEITGIADAVRLAGSTEANLLKIAISLLQEIADKPTISDRDIFDSVGKQYGEKAKRNGYSRDPVFG